MALIKLSSIGITNLSGKAGGSVFSHNRGGSYVRNFAVPSNPDTPAQSAARAAFGAFASAWRALTQEARNLWVEAAKNFPYIDRFGDTKVMSGENLFISLNRNLEVAGEAAITSPPIPQGVDGVVSLEVVVSLNAGTLSFSVSGSVGPNDEATTNYIAYVTAPMSAGIGYAKNRYRLLGANFTENELTTGKDIASAYEALFEIPPAGSKVFVKLAPVNIMTGERGAEITASAIVEDVTP